MPDAQKPYKAPATALSDRVVAIGASAGGMKALQTLLGALPSNFPWPILLVQHLHPDHKTHLPEILSRTCGLSVKLAKQGDCLKSGMVLIAPPSHHLTLAADHTVALNEHPKVHFSRPSIDTLFESVATVCGPAAIAIILTGSNADGADGIRAIKASGGITIAQSLASAQARQMPAAAIDTGSVEHSLDLPAIAEHLVQLTQCTEAGVSNSESGN